MIYLDVARAVVYDTRETRKVWPEEVTESAPEDEENEENEESARTAVLPPEEAEQMKAQIVTAASVEPAEFDRAAYDRLWARWKAHEAACNAT